MPQDYARNHRNQAPTQPGPPRWTWFIAGCFLGGFLVFLTMLWFLAPGNGEPIADVPQPGAEPRVRAQESSDEMQWDFYEIFPRSVVPVVEEYLPSGEKRAVDDARWILQAGSFRDPNDADERRAELLLLGLSVTTSKVQMEGGTWHRVIVGPFDTELERNRAQDKLAQAEIQSIPIRVPRT